MQRSFSHDLPQLGGEGFAAAAIRKRGEDALREAASDAEQRVWISIVPPSAINATVRDGRDCGAFAHLALAGRRRGPRYLRPRVVPITYHGPCVPAPRGVHYG